MQIIAHRFQWNSLLSKGTGVYQDSSRDTKVTQFLLPFSIILSPKASSLQNTRRCLLMWTITAFEQTAWIASAPLPLIPTEGDPHGIWKYLVAAGWHLS
jgi:hypothetical protein